MLDSVLNEESSYCVVSRECEFSIGVDIRGIINRGACKLNIDGGLVEAITGLQNI